VHAFLDHACLRYQGHDAPERRSQAGAWLAASPWLGRSTLWGAAATADVVAVQKHLDADVDPNGPGPDGWAPLLHLCFGRVLCRDADAVGVLVALLDAGADPRAHFVAWGSPFTGLTGAIGEGERGVDALPPHPEADALVDVLLAGGADPNDSQALYNTMLRPTTHWLRRLLAAGLDAQQPLRWPMPGGPSTLDFLLAHAAGTGDLERLELLLEHGADAACIDPYSGRTALTLARLEGRGDVVRRLRAAGAQDEVLASADTLRAALAKGDWEVALEAEIDTADLGGLVRWAAGSHRVEALRWLLARGAPVDAAGDDGVRALHLAVSHDDPVVLELLVEQGACLDAVEHRFGATPLGWARHQRRGRAVAFLEAREKR